MTVLLALSRDRLIDSGKSYFYGIGALCLAYFVIQLFYIFYVVLSMDDLWLAYHTYHYKTALPYRDFFPYKTVLGYYVLLVPMIFFHGLLSPLLYTKCWIALINTIFLGGISLWLKRFFSSKAIFMSLVLIVSTQTFLSNSSDIRVDLLAYWLCLISALFLFEENYFLAGISIAVGFLICQKAVWYIIATNGGLAGYWIFSERSRKMAKNIFIFNFFALITLLIYILFWAYFSNLTTVLHSIFYEAYLISSLDWYNSSYTYFWNVIIANNPGLVLLWPFALFGLFIIPADRRVFIIIYTLVILFFIISCKQPFCYYLLAAIPALFLLYSTFFSALYTSFSFFQLIKFHKKLIIGFSFLYNAGLIFLYDIFVFPTAYLIASLIPILLVGCLFLGDKKETDVRSAFIISIFYLFFLIGIVFSLVCFIKMLPDANGRYEKSMIYLMNNLLKKGDGYIAGVPLLLNVEQPVPGLIHLVGPTIDYFDHPSKKLYPIMKLSSLYFSPVTIPQIIESIKRTPVKLYVDNNRFHALSPTLFRFLETEYQHFWGSIYLYAPKMKAGRERIQIKFSGNYKISSEKKEKNVRIYLNHKKILPNSIIYLKKQMYISDASTTYRLVFIPNQAERWMESGYRDKRILEL